MKFSSRVSNKKWIASLAAVMLLFRRWCKGGKTPKRVWIKPYNRLHEEQGAFHNLFTELKKDEATFTNFAIFIWKVIGHMTCSVRTLQKKHSLTSCETRHTIQPEPPKIQHLNLSHDCPPTSRRSLKPNRRTTHTTRANSSVGSGWLRSCIVCQPPPPPQFRYAAHARPPLKRLAPQIQNMYKIKNMHRKYSKADVRNRQIGRPCV